MFNSSLYKRIHFLNATIIMKREYSIYICRFYYFNFLQFFFSPGKNNYEDYRRNFHYHDLHTILTDEIIAQLKRYIQEYIKSNK